MDLNLIFIFMFLNIYFFFSFPKPYLSFCKPTVLVESYVKAESLSSFLTHDPLGSKLFRQRLASVGMTAFLKMILVDNFTHADLHPGNILVSSIPAEERNSMDVLANGGERTISKENHQGKSFGDLDIPCITFLDAGIIAELSQEDRYTNLYIYIYIYIYIFDKFFFILIQIFLM